MPWLLITIIFLVIILNVRLRYVGRKFDIQYDKERLFEEEQEANLSRVRPLEEGMLIKLSESDFPFKYHYESDKKPDSDILRIQNKIKLNLEMPIIKTDIKTNTEVKKRFGAANLQMVIDGEENFTRLMQRLNQWAKYLIEAGNILDAERILEKAVLSRSDISETYILLYGIYESTGRREKLASLKENAENLPEIAKARIKRYIDEAENHLEERHD